MVIRCFILFFLLFSISLYSLDADIPEAHLQELENRFWDELLPEAEDFSELKKGLRIYTAVRFQDMEAKLNNHLQKKMDNARLDILESSDFANKQHEYKVSFRFSPQKSVLKELALAHYRIGFGNALVLGYKRNQDQVFCLDHGANPLSYSPFGTAFILQRGMLKLMAFSSVQQRAATFSDTLISQLGTRKADKLSQTKEELLGIALAYQKDATELALLFYKQDYDRDFSEDKVDSWDQAISLYFKERLGLLELKSENVIFGKDFGGYYQLQYSAGAWKHALVYVEMPAVHTPAYRANPFALGNSLPRRELSYDINYHFMKNASTRINIALSQKTNSLYSSDTLQRMFYELKLKILQSSHQLRFYEFDRELISNLDSTYVNSIPTHYRLHYQVSHQINKSSSFRLKCAYHQEEKASFTKNSFLWDTSVAFYFQPSNLRLGFKTWHTSRNIYLLSDDNIESEAYSILQNRGTLAYLNATWRFKALKLFLSYYQSLEQIKDNTLSLGFHL